MCTVTWRHSEEGYDVLFNRDELKTRKPALPPRPNECYGVRYLAPVDGNAGGAWIGVNEFGVCLTLLNFYEVAQCEEKSDYVSRGRLLVSLLNIASRAEVISRIQNADLGSFQPFILLAFSFDTQVSQFISDGRDLTHNEIGASHLPITTSSFANRQVAAQRRRCLQEFKSEPGEFSVEELLRFHRSHVPFAGAYSVCMHRDDAHTVSFSHVIVRRTQIEFHYHPDSPCKQGAETVAHLPHWV